MQTETQGKVFIVAGSIGLLISAYFLVTALFPWSDNRNNEPTIETTNTWEQVSLQTDTEVDFEEILLDWQDKTLHVLIPEFLFSSWFKTIQENIKDTIWFDIVFHTPATIQDIKEREEERKINEQIIDIALIPTDIIYWLTNNSKSLDITESLSPYYHSSFGELLDQEWYTFIPHIIDPLVILSQEENKTVNNTQQRFDIITQRETAERWHFPILFWRTIQDRQFIKQERELFPNHFLLFYHIISQITQTQDPVQSLKTLLDIQELTTAKMRNVGDFINITRKIEEETEECRLYPNLCLLNKKEWSITFWLLSDIHKIEKNFPDTEYHIYPFRFNNTYPARWRGFLVNTNTPIESRALYFLENYIQSSLIDIDPDLRDRTIAASLNANNTINDINTQWDLYSNENNRSMLISNKNYMTESYMIQWFIQVREWLLTPEQFISNINNN